MTPPGGIPLLAGDLDLRQVKIGAILRAGYEGALTLDGAQIPESDLYREPSLYQIELRPEAGSARVFGCDVLVG